MSRYAPHMVMGLIALVVAATAFYALAFETVYSRPHPAIQASRWINENVARNSTIVTDNHWDEGIPEIYRYRVRQIPIYDSDNRDKMGTIADHLAEGDYLVFYSNRTYGSVARLPGALSAQLQLLPAPVFGDSWVTPRRWPSPPIRGSWA